MKKVIVMIAVLSAIVITSCKKEHKHGPDTHEHDTEVVKHESHDTEKGDMAMAEKYQCPMDCEKGKTYDKEGTCPTCKMQLNKLKKDNDKAHKHEDGEEHSH